MSYKPDQTDLQIVTQNVSTQASALLAVALRDADVTLEDIADQHETLTKLLMDNVISEITDRIDQFDAPARKAPARGRSSGGSRRSGSSSRGSRSGGGRSSSGSGGSSSAKASAKQVKFLLDLLEGREHDYDYTEDDLVEMSMSKAKALISELLDAPELD